MYPKLLLMLVIATFATSPGTKRRRNKKADGRVLSQIDVLMSGLPCPLQREPCMRSDRGDGRLLN